jgi:hypothetical protein
VNEAELLEMGLKVAAGFFGLGLLVLFFSSVLLGLVDFIRRFIG